MRYKAYTLFMLCVSIIFLSVAATVPAADISLVPSIEARAEYDDNIYFSRTNKQGDYIGIISPELTFTALTERSRFSALARLDAFRYLDETDLNTVNQRYELSGSHQLLERLELRATAGYLKDTTLESELEETGYAGTRTKRKSFNGGLGISFVVNEISTIDIDYAYRKTDYDSEESEDYKSHTASAAYTHIFNNGIDTLRIRPVYTHTAYETSKENTYRLYLSLLHLFSDTLRGTIAAGPRYTTIDYDAGNSENNWGWVAEISIEKSWQATSLIAGYTRDIRPSRTGDSIEVNRIFLTFTHRLTEQWRLGLTGAGYLSKTESDLAYSEYIHYYEVTPTITYNLMENAFIECSYRYSHEYDKNLDHDRDLDRNRIWIRFTIEFPQNW